MKHDAEKRAQALASIAENGVAKTHEATGIAMQTLYKWSKASNVTPFKATRHKPDSPNQPQKMPAKKKVTQAVVDKDDLRQAIISDKFLEEKVQKLEAENRDLRDENAQLREKSANYRKALMALLG